MTRPGSLLVADDKGDVEVLAEEVAWFAAPGDEKKKLRTLRRRREREQRAAEEQPAPKPAPLTAEAFAALPKPVLAGPTAEGQAFLARERARRAAFDRSEMATEDAVDALMRAEMRRGR